MYRALWDRRHSGATRIRQCTRRYAPWLILVAPSCLRSHNARYIMLISLSNHTAMDCLSEGVVVAMWAITGSRERINNDVHRFLWNVIAHPCKYTMYTSTCKYRLYIYRERGGREIESAHHRAYRWRSIWLLYAINKYKHVYSIVVLAFNDARDCIAIVLRMIYKIFWYIVDN